MILLAVVEKSRDYLELLSKRLEGWQIQQLSMSLFANPSKFVHAHFSRTVASS